MKQPKELIMNDENVNKNIDEPARKVNNSKEATDVVKEVRKIIKSNKCSILWLAYQQGNIFEKFKANYIYINMVNQWTKQIYNGF